MSVSVKVSVIIETLLFLQKSFGYDRNYPKFVVTLDKFQRPNRNGIVHVLAPEFHRVLERV